MPAVKGRNLNAGELEMLRWLLLVLRDSPIVQENVADINDTDVDSMIDDVEKTMKLVASFTGVKFSMARKISMPPKAELVDIMGAMMEVKATLEAQMVTLDRLLELEKPGPEKKEKAK